MKLRWFRMPLFLWIGVFTVGMCVFGGVAFAINCNQGCGPITSICESGSGGETYIEGSCNCSDNIEEIRWRNPITRGTTLGEDRISFMSVTCRTIRPCVVTATKYNSKCSSVTGSCYVSSNGSCLERAFGGEVAETVPTCVVVDCNS